MIVRCTVCDTPFERADKTVRYAQKLGKKLYCGYHCASIGRHRDKGRQAPISLSCIKCGTSFTRSSGVAKSREAQGMRGPYCSRKCAVTDRHLKENIKEYRRRHHSDGRNLREHRHIMEQKLGRVLSPSELVHHVDEDKHNNSPDNLELTTRADHARIHHQKR